MDIERPAVNPSSEEIRRAVVRAIADSLFIDEKEVSADARLVEDLGMDSLDFLDIMFALEKALNMKIRDPDFDGLMRPGGSRADAGDAFLSDADVERLSPFIPLLKQAAAKEKIRRMDLFSLVTAETLMRMIERKVAGT